MKRSDASIILVVVFLIAVGVRYFIMNGVPEGPQAQQVPRPTVESSEVEEEPEETDDDDEQEEIESDVSGEPNEPINATDVSELPPILCDASIEFVCDSLASDGLPVRVEPATESLERLSTLQRTDTDAPLIWVAPEPFINMLEAKRSANELPSLFSQNIVRAGYSPVVHLSWPIESQEILQSCGKESISWGCPYVNSDGVTVSIGDPAVSSLNSMVLMNGIGAQVGSYDIGPAVLESPKFQRWFDIVSTSVQNDEGVMDVAQKMVTNGPRETIVGVTFEAQALAAKHSGERYADDLRIHYPEARELFIVDAAVVMQTNVEADNVHQIVRQSLEENHWYTTSSEPVLFEAASFGDARFSYRGTVALENETVLRLYNEMRAILDMSSQESVTSDESEPDVTDEQPDNEQLTDEGTP